MSLGDELTERIRSTGPLRLSDYIELALYHPEFGYYTRADRRSGAAGDFFTSADVGTLFGELLSHQFDEMHQLLDRATSVDLVEAAAGSGRLSRAVLDSAADHHPGFYEAVRLTLVERSPAARAAQLGTLGHHGPKLADSAEAPPDGLRGIVFANELLDALPVHSLVMTHRGLREVYVDLDRAGRFVESLGSPSDAVVSHVERFGIALEPGWRVEVSPAAVRWIEETGARLDRGFLVLIDYGHEASELYSATHATGTLATYGAHVQLDNAERGGIPPWLKDPGSVDITAHVDLTAVRRAATEVGLDTLAIVDQTYFLLGLGAGDPIESRDGMTSLKRRLALKTLLLPGGLGSTHKVMVFGKGVGTPSLRGISFSQRST